MSRAELPERRIFRSTSATITLIVAGVVGAFLLGDAFIRAGLGETLLLAPWVLLIVWVVYAVVYVPRVETDAEGITIVNVLRHTRVPWGRVTDMDTRWQLVVHVDDGSRVAAFGGPSLRPARRRPFSGESTQADAARYSDAALILGQWDDAREDARPSGAVSARWNLPAILSFAALAAWALIAVLIVNGNG